MVNDHRNNSSHLNNITTGQNRCIAGLLLPEWLPDIEQAAIGDSSSVKVYRAVVYLLALAYMLFGVNIMTDRMISCIEVIVTQKRTVTATLKNGKIQTINVPIWHPVVATLTIHVIGASAAEILDEISALVTLAFFPTVVFTAWFVERQFYLKIRRILKQCTSAIFPSSSFLRCAEDHPNNADECEYVCDTEREFERRRRVAEFLRHLKAAHPEKSDAELEGMTEVELLESLSKDAAFYRMQASKDMSGGGDVISKDKIQKLLEHDRKLKAEVNVGGQLVGFEQAEFTCLESCGSAVMTVTRSGPGVESTLLFVDYETVEGTAIEANAKTGKGDYERKRGTLQFKPGSVTADISIKIVDDDEFEELKSFKVILKNPRFERPPPGDKQIEVIITQKETTVKILDDDHCGVFHFRSAIVSFPDNIGTAKIRVIRSTGARGQIKVPFNVIDGTAKGGHDFTPPPGLHHFELVFNNNESGAFIEIPITDLNRVGEVVSFFIELRDPIILSQSPQNSLGNPVLGEPAKIEIRICEDDKLGEVLDRLLLIGDIADIISSITWAEQFRDTIKIEHGDNKNRSRTCANLLKAKTYLLYGLSLPWKLLAAAIPPACYFHGWLAFILLLIVMALLSALIGDLASAFGCTVGLKDRVTAITLIAFGMGLPDMFASRHAAMHEHTADAAIGGITGTNAVNVFLGIGMSWLAGAAYHANKGTKFKIPSGNMGFVVVVYCILATAAVITLMLRRLPPIRGELGGPRSIKYASSALLLMFWLTFILMLTLQSYGAMF